MWENEGRALENDLFLKGIKIQKFWIYEKKGLEINLSNRIYSFSICRLYIYLYIDYTYMKSTYQ